MTEGSERKNFWRNRLYLAVVHWPLGLLLATFRRAIFGEILDRRRDDHPVLRQALRETLAQGSALWRCRREHRDDSGANVWRRFLVPPGSVPVITLPEIDGDATTDAPESSDPKTAETESKTRKKTSPKDPERDADLPSDGEHASSPGMQSVVDYLTEAVASARNELDAERRRTEQAEAQHVHVRNEMHQIHTSKMWKLWMTYLSVRRWIFPFRRGS